MSSRKGLRSETPEYHKARILAEELDDKNLVTTIDILRTMLAAYGDVLFVRRKKADPEKLAALYQMLTEREKRKK